jgi:phosphoribosylformylglycinamidine cyclo-ligase
MQKMREFDIEMWSGGGETADVGDLVRTIIVDSTLTARMPRNEIISANKIREGDVVVGLASFGQAAWEEEYNGGMGSNGLTSARHDILNHTYASQYPESFDPAIPEALRYSGTRLLQEEIEGIPVGKLILSPTRTYAPLLKRILTRLRPHIHGLIHCTGGGQTKVLRFINDLNVVKDQLFDIPPLFQLIEQESGTPRAEMYQVFNMGHRMEVYLPEQYAQEVVDLAREVNIEARIIGRCEAASGRKVSIKDGLGEYIFEG